MAQRHSERKNHAPCKAAIRLPNPGGVVLTVIYCGTDSATLPLGGVFAWPDVPPPRPPRSAPELGKELMDVGGSSTPHCDSPRTHAHGSPRRQSPGLSFSRRRASLYVVTRVPCARVLRVPCARVLLRISESLKYVKLKCVSCSRSFISCPSRRAFSCSKRVTSWIKKEFR